MKKQFWQSICIQIEHEKQKTVRQYVATDFQSSKKWNNLRICQHIFTTWKRIFELLNFWKLFGTIFAQFQQPICFHDSCLGLYLCWLCFDWFYYETLNLKIRFLNVGQFNCCTILTEDFFHRTLFIFIAQQRPPKTSCNK